MAGEGGGEGDGRKSPVGEGGRKVRTRDRKEGGSSVEMRTGGYNIPMVCAAATDGTHSFSTKRPSTRELSCGGWRYWGGGGG